MRRLACVLVLLVGTAGCKRSGADSYPPEPEPEPSEVVSSSEPSNKPEGCADAEDCASKGATAILAGDPAGVVMLEYACSEGSRDGCQTLSMMQRNGAVPEDLVKAHLAAERGCELGSLIACVDLGMDASLGLGGASVDYEAAIGHFTAACEGGVSVGCRNAGILQHEGRLGSPDPHAASKYFAAGCEQGDAESCFNAGVLLGSDLLGPPDFTASLQFMTHACELGDQEGCDTVEVIAAEIEAQASKIPGANLRVGSATVNDLTVEELECRVSGGGGLLGNMALIASLAERKAAIDKCGAAGARAEVTWTAAGGKITKADGEGKLGACVAKVLMKVSPPVNGECAATIVLGP